MDNRIETGIERLQRIVDEKMAKYKPQDVDEPDGTPVDSTTCYMVSVEARSLNPNYRYRDWESGKCAGRELWQILTKFSTKERPWSSMWGVTQNFIHIGYEDLSIMAPTKEIAIELVIDLNRLLPVASDYWSDSVGLKSGVNAFVRAYPMSEEGIPDLTRPGPVNFIED